MSKGKALMIKYWLTGAIFGLCNGVSPGPTLTLTISQTLLYGWREGVKVALSPLLFGFIIIPIFLLFTLSIPQVHLFISIVSICGALFLFKLSYCHFSATNIPLGVNLTANKLVKNVLIVNFFSFQAYVFWLSVGVPIVFSAIHMHEKFGVFSYLAGYYVLLIGVKLLIVKFAEFFRLYLVPEKQLIILKVTGAIFAIFASLFLINGIKELARL